jgi:small GTP-binding protein
MIFKIVLLGDSNVGKSNILSKYLHNEFNQDSKSTVGVEFGSKTFEIDEKTTIKAQIWDTAGQERYRSITNSYYKGAKGAFIVYDITKKSSFENVDSWLNDLKLNNNENINIILIGNKSDLEEKREISVEIGEKKAINNKIGFIETSAKNGNNIEKVFDEMIKNIYEKNKEDIENKNQSGEFGVGNEKSIELNLDNNKENNNNNKNSIKKKCCGKN